MMMMMILERFIKSEHFGMLKNTVIPDVETKCFLMPTCRTLNIQYEALKK
jgi:hypothetical protein